MSRRITLPHTDIVAHRGFSRAAPENTMAAFKKAQAAGADGIELDVQLTKDGEIVVIHDETVDRTTNGSGWIKDLTLAEMQKLDAGRWFAVEYSGEPIPTLRYVLEWMAETSLWVNIELKNNRFPYPGLEEKVVKEVERVGLEERVVLSSFNPLSLRNLAAYRPALERALLYEYKLAAPWVYAKYIGVSAIHPHFTAIKPEIVNRCRKEGIAVRPYTVDEEETMSELIEAGVDAIITNVPERLFWLLND
jgi:glycerophosphoryl diester phosphodiesterase